MTVSTDCYWQHPFCFHTYILYTTSKRWDGFIPVNGGTKSVDLSKKDTLVFLWQLRALKLLSDCCISVCLTVTRLSCYVMTSDQKDKGLKTQFNSFTTLYMYLPVCYSPADKECTVLCILGFFPIAKIHIVCLSLHNNRNRKCYIFLYIF